LQPAGHIMPHTWTVLHFVWPLALLIVALIASYWVLVMFQPDIVYWAAAVAVVGISEGRARGNNGVASLRERE
jgi:hypothetical protein